MDRAYSTLTIKSIDLEQRVIEGIASSPEPDRAGDVLVPEGAQFQLPMPLLWQHSPDLPIGEVTAATVTASGITITAKLAQVDEAGRLKDRLDEAWQSIKARLVRGLSVGLKPVDAVPRKKGDPFSGLHIKRWIWAETSAVTLPMNVAATITAIKSAAAPGGLPDRLGAASLRVPTMTYPEQITAQEAKRATVVASMASLMQTATDAGSTLSGDDSKQYDTWAGEVKSLDAHLVRLRELETLNAGAAQPVPRTPSPTTPVVQVKSQLPQGTAFVRAACALLTCKGNTYEAVEYAKRWNDSTPEVGLYLKAAVAAGNTTDTTWASPLVNQTISNEFLELLRPATILGKVPNLRRVPFNVKVPSQTAGGTYGWVGEAKPKPVTKLAFSAETLGIAKAAGIIVLTEELVRLSNPSAEALVRADMIAGIAQFLDTQFIDPAVAAVAGTNPASITNGASTAAATANPMADILGLIAHFSTNNIPVDGVTIIMSSVNALALSFQVYSDGTQKFPGIGINGGNFKGITIVTSQAAGTNIIALQPSLILYADDGGVSIDVSREASLQMDSAPASPADATTVLVSLWQHNLVGLRAERFVNWKRVGTTSVKYLTAAAYPAPAGAEGTPLEV